MVSASGKVWFVTGAAAGLGLALTRCILARGDKVIATGRSASQFGELLSDTSIDQTRLRVLTLDVTAPFADIKRQVDSAIGIWGRIDVLVNNAGICTFGATEEIGAQGMMHVMQTNFIGVLNVTNAILPHMRNRREGFIAFIGSRSAFRNQITVRPYSASKAAVHSYAETLSVEMCSFNVKVLIVIPGIFDTKINAPQRVGTPLPGYETAHEGMDAMIKFVANTPKGDPALGMSVLVDVVRGEGCAVGRPSIPLWLFLGEDCMRDVRTRLDQIGSVINEWEVVGTRLGLPAAVL
ncbi:NAD-P-binding protein [Multifurca ochricompacta]|uniref:NAD-P-binding protein n=1 Tax=Multifurca ochricompacta TaxID=376703 RepID=A0AAD4M4V2_9AGAM|nr:NAD-P-binding protein [Multifurca ochricompacta]